MYWHVLVGGFAGALALLAIIPYVKDILYGTTRPNIFTWALWELLLLISVFAQFSAGASWSIMFLVGDIIGTGIIVLLCLFGYGYGKYGRLEWICTTLAIIALASWQLTSEPILAILFAILADALAAVPTVFKTYRDPWSEAPGQYFIIALASVLAISSTMIFNLPNLIFPAYLLLINGLIGTLAFSGRKIRHKSF